MLDRYGYWVLKTAKRAALLAAEPDMPAVGEFVPDIDKWTVSASINPTSGQVALAYFTAKRSETITKMRVLGGATAAAATPTLIRFGIYSVAANGDLTLVTATTSDTALFASTFAKAEKTLATPFAKVVGQRYATAVLVTSGATMPNFIGHTVVSASWTNELMSVAPRRSGIVAGQTNLPASIAAGSVTNTPFRVGVYLS